MSLKSAGILKREIVLGSKIKGILMVGMFAVLTFLAAMVRIPLPFTPVPMTMQTFVLFLSVYYLSSWQAGIAQSVYVLAGMFGIPVFAAGIAGAIAVTGPTAGYLAGFIVAAFIMAVIREKTGKTGFLSMVMIFAAGTIVVYTLGAAHLVLVYKIPVKSAIAMGVLPFIPVDVLKIAAAAAFVRVKK